MDVFLEINGHRLTARPRSIYRTMMKLLIETSFDMDHLVPWLQKIDIPAPADPS
jgi:prophage maintenance system killer protein